MKIHRPNLKLKYAVHRLGNNFFVISKRGWYIIAAIVVASTSLSVLLHANKAYASSVGPSSPTAAVSVSNGGSTGWTSPTNVEASDGNYASVSLGAKTNSYDLEATGYGFSVPSTATINGVYVQVQEYAPTSTKSQIEDYTVSLLVGGTITGSNLATATAWPSTDTSNYYGSSTNLWGTTLSPSQVNASNFGVAVAAQNVKTAGPGATLSAYVDYISVTVYYTVPYSTNQTSNQFYQNQTGSYATGASWSEATTAAAWPGRSAFTGLVYDNKMWVMGGYNGTTYYNDVWYSTDGVNWTEATAAAPWAARNNMVALSFDNKMWVMGGYNGSYYNDVWYSTDGVNWTEATAAAPWAGRAHFTAMVYNNEMWVMGGTNGTSMLNDVWYSTDGVNWTEATTGAGWPVREGQVGLVYNNEMWIMGGENAVTTTYYNDVWYSTNGVTWTEATTGASWATRYFFGGTVYNNEMWIMGGQEGSSELNDVWYSTDGVNWTEATTGAGWAQRFSPLALNYNNEIWAMGGGNGTSYFDDVWYTTMPAIGVGAALAAQNTTVTAPSDQQPFRLRMDIAITGGSLAANLASYQLEYALLSGGSCSATPSSSYVPVTNNSTVQYYNNPGAANGQSLNTSSGEPTDGTNIIVPEEYLGYGTTTFSDPTAIPAGEDGMWDFALTTYHALSGQQYCFMVVNSGGAALNTYTDYPEITIPASTVNQSSYRFFQNQDAATSGASWTAATSTPGWAARSGAATVVFNNETWIMGGDSSSGTALNDVWYSTNGTSWTEATAAAPWAARYDASAVVYNNEMWIMGGWNGTTYYNDAWYSTDGINWYEATTAAPWAARNNATAVVYNNQMWLMGGWNGSTYYNDVWYSTDGFNWTEATAAAPWAARYGATTVVYNGEMWTMGGWNGSTYYNDVWYSANGSTWTESTAAAAWPAEYGLSSVVYNNEIWEMAGISTAGANANVYDYVLPSINVGLPLANQSTPVDLNGPALKQPFRLRMDINIANTIEPVNGLSLDLQYAELGDYASCSVIPSANFTNVTTTTPIQFYTNAVATNGMPLTANANDPTDGTNTLDYQSYNQANPFTNNQSSVYVGQDGLWDFALAVSSSIYNHASYCLRAVNSSNGSILSGYNDYPQINLAPTMKQLMNNRAWWNSSGVQQNLDIYHD